MSANTKYTHFFNMNMMQSSK